MSVTRRRVKASKPPADPILGVDLDWILSSTKVHQTKDRDPAIVLAAAAAALNIISGNAPLRVRRIGPGAVIDASVITPSSNEKVAAPVDVSGGPISVCDQEPVGMSFSRVALIGDEEFDIVEVRLGKQQGVLCMARAAPGVIPGLQRVATLEMNLRELLTEFTTLKDGQPVRIAKLMAGAMDMIGPYEGASIAIEAAAEEARVKAEETKLKVEREQVLARAAEYTGTEWGAW